MNKAFGLEFNFTYLLIFVLTTYIVSLIIMRKKLAIHELGFHPQTDKKKLMNSIHFFLGVVLLVMLTAGWFLIQEGIHKERLNLHERYKALSRNFTYSLHELNHEKITTTTSLSDDRYQKIQEQLNEWLKLNPEIVHIYTLRKDAKNSYVVLVDAGGYLDKNGNFEVREKVLPLGTITARSPEALEQASSGVDTLEKGPQQNPWGYTIGAFTPIYNDNGTIDAVLGIDFNGHGCMTTANFIEFKYSLYLALPFILFLSLYWIIFFYRVKEITNVDYFIHHDTLTDLPNRLMFNEKLKFYLNQTTANQELMGIMFIDLDNFKQINDIFGHAQGDIILKKAASLIKACVSPKDMVARWGGDEFTVLIPKAKSQEEITKIADSICKIFKAPLVTGTQEHYLTTSIGISIYPLQGLDMDTLIKKADSAMYRAKEQGKNNFQLYHP